MRKNSPFLLGLLFLASLPLAGCSRTPSSDARNNLKDSDEGITVEPNLQIRENQSRADNEAKMDKASIDVRNLAPIGDRFRVKPYLQAAALLQSMGKEKACKRLAELAENGGDGKVEILCRMLFSRRLRGSLRPPSLGEPVCLGGTNAHDWPSLPIEIVDGIPFSIVLGYNIGGEGQPSRVYLKYCIQNGDWSAMRYEAVNQDTLEKALKKLLACGKWKRPLTNDEVQFLSSQIM